MSATASMNDLLEIRVEKRGSEDNVGYVTVNNPRKRNALGMPGKRAITVAFRKLSQDDKLRAVVLTGAGDKSFIAGADIAEMKDLTADEAREEHTLTHLANQSIRTCPVPVIARINGYCLGLGMELAASCDMRAAADHAKFGMPEVRMDIPSGMEAALLPRIIGRGRTSELVFTGDYMDAEEAYRCHFIEKVVPSSDLDRAVETWIASILAAGPRAIRLQKALMRDWDRMSIDDAIRQGIEACVEARSTDEPRRLREAFSDRRKSRDS